MTTKNEEKEWKKMIDWNGNDNQENNTCITFFCKF